MSEGQRPALTVHIRKQGDERAGTPVHRVLPPPNIRAETDMAGPSRSQNDAAGADRVKPGAAGRRLIMVGRTAGCRKRPSA